MNASALLRILLEKVDQEIHEEIAKIQNPEENLPVIADELRKIILTNSDRHNRSFVS